jgi:hypothetical protein
METVHVPPGLSGSAWIRSAFKAYYSGTVDVSGVRQGDAGQLTCDSWLADSGMGLSITAEGAFTVIGCGNELSVACCAPVP